MHAIWNHICENWDVLAFSSAVVLYLAIRDVRKKKKQIMFKG